MTGSIFSFRRTQRHNDDSWQAREARWIRRYGPTQARRWL